MADANRIRQPLAHGGEARQSPSNLQPGRPLRAAVARAELPKVVTAGVLTSDSDASYTDQRSTGTAVTDGVQLGVLDAVHVVLLHSEVATDGRGHS